ncbi:MAG TPA: ABC transporter ATP-binding protein, partial [Gemmatimonadales bacterium]|nr:ABC transporter ATP-binding protein [Gemmatimonadales bacterium]
ILEARGVTVQYRGAPNPAVNDVELTLGPGELVALVGPNGCGKTSLVHALLGLVPLRAGTVSLERRPIGEWSRPELARLVALVPQREDTPFSWRVEDMVGFGRYARLGPLSPMSVRDHEAVDRALARCDVDSLRHRPVETLSGGEWQRVRIARALAQEPALLVLDEPTASLDLGHEMELFELVAQLVTEGLSALVVTHHLNLAARYADRMLLLDRGRVAAAGPPAEVMRPDLLSGVFRWPVGIVSLQGAPHVVPERRDGGGGR